jgi:group I intron endonuclease
LTNLTLYRIVNTKNNKKYIGITSNALKSRWAYHLHRLRHGKAPAKLQSAYDEYGESSFIIEPIASGNKSDIMLLERELSTLTVVDGYNSVIGGGGADEMRRISAVGKLKMKTNPEHRRMVGDKISKANKGRVISEATKEKMSKTRKAMGLKWSDDMRAKVAETKARTGSRYGRFKLFLNIETGIFYTTPELQLYFGKSKYLRNMGDVRLNKFIKLK